MRWKLCKKIIVAAVLSICCCVVFPIKSITSFVYAAVTANDLALEMGLSTTDISSGNLGASSQIGVAILNTSIAGFPTQGSGYVVLSTGRAEDALRANTEGSYSYVLDGLNTSQGDDLVQLTLILNVPDNATSLSFDWKFLSEEYPEWVGTAYNDAFLVEMDNSNFAISGNTITAPNNVAFDSNGQLITINTTGALGMTESNALGTTYDGATPLLTTTVPISSGVSTITLIFSVFDMGDSVYDSTVFIDNLHFDTVSGGSDPTTKKTVDLICNVPATIGEDSTISVSATLIDSTTSDPISGETIEWSVVPDGPTSSATTDSFGNAQTVLDLSGLANGTYSIKTVFLGNDTYQQISNEASFEIIEVNNNNAPMISTPGDGTVFTATEGDTITFNVVATDNDVTDGITITNSGLPANASFTSVYGNPATGSFGWTTEKGNAGIYTTTFTAEDSNNAFSSPVTVTLIVEQKPVSAGKVTAGGAQTNKGTNFGFNVKSSDGKTFTGQLQYNDKSSNIKLHSVNITSLYVYPSGTMATFEGTATNNGVGKYAFTVTVEDNGEPGRNDTFIIKIPELQYTSSGQIVKGNVQIHK